MHKHDYIEEAGEEEELTLTAFEEIPSLEQKLSFHTLEKELIYVMHIETVRQEWI